MKFNSGYALLAIVPLLTSCASEHVALFPAGPNPDANRPSSDTGYLQVFSQRSGLCLIEDREG